VKRYRITTLGCKVNQCESEGIARALSDAGWIAAPEGPVDLVVVNTCAVTGKAAMQSRGAVRQAARTCPGARVVATGCHAQTESERLAEIPGVTAVVGHADKHRIPEMARELAAETAGEPPGPRMHIRDLTDFREFAPAPALGIGERTRPFLKIQDGCDAFCAYCVVPHARGRSRSMETGAVLQRIAAMAEAGVKETVLTGIHLGRWGQDLSPPTSLAALLRQIDAQGRMARVRLSSIESHELTDDLLWVLAESERFCRHLHIPLQSGDDGVLHRMERPYTAVDFAERVTTAARRLPDAAIGADVLMGFPGEDEKAFENTHALVNDLPVTHLHVFPFSPRAGTPAADFSGRASPDRVKERCRKMRALGAAKRAAFYRRFLGRTVSVLVEETRDRQTGRRKGVSGNYLNVLVKGGGEESANRIVPVRIEALDGRERAVGTVQR
jgi:threonylcarbamoyladenosine tRNA methylthiotransferase MtaB